MKGGAVRPVQIRSCRSHVGVSGHTVRRRERAASCYVQCNTCKIPPTADSKQHRATSKGGATATMPIPKELSLTDDELDELLASSWNMRIATVGPGTRIDMTPLWFVWVDGRIFTYCRGQKVANLRRNPQATILVDRNERFPELVGAMFQGRLACSRTPTRRRLRRGWTRRAT